MKFNIGDRVLVKDDNGFGVLLDWKHKKTILHVSYVEHDDGKVWIGLNGARESEWKAERFQLVREKDPEYDELFI